MCVCARSRPFLREMGCKTGGSASRDQAETGTACRDLSNLGFLSALCLLMISPLFLPEAAAAEVVAASRQLDEAFPLGLPRLFVRLKRVPHALHSWGFSGGPLRHWGDSHTPQ